MWRALLRCVPGLIACTFAPGAASAIELTLSLGTLEAPNFRATAVKTSIGDKVFRLAAGEVVIIGADLPQRERDLRNVPLRARAHRMPGRRPRNGRLEDARCLPLASEDAGARAHRGSPAEGDLASRGEDAGSDPQEPGRRGKRVARQPRGLDSGRAPEDQRRNVRRKVRGRQLQRAELVGPGHGAGSGLQRCQRRARRREARRRRPLFRPARGGGVAVERHARVDRRRGVLAARLSARHRPGAARRGPVRCAAHRGSPCVPEAARHRRAGGCRGGLGPHGGARAEREPHARGASTPPRSTSRCSSRISPAPRLPI